MQPITKFIRHQTKQLARQPRDARYVIVLIVSSIIFLLTYLQALSNGLFDSFERPIFNAVNSLPHAFFPVFYAATQFGGLASLLLWLAAAWYLVNRRAAITLLIGGVFAYMIAKIAKDSVQRGRPGSLLPHIHLFNGESFTGYGFPSGHSTFSAACATILYYQVAPRYRKYILLIVFMVGLSRMYLGAHFPLDVVGGWALGAAIGSLVVLIAGVSKKGLSAAKLKKALKARGYDIQQLRFANVDARGSRPVFIRLEDGREYFAKIFGKHEHAADWLFKIYRFFRYKNLQAEEPYVNSRRNIELEAFATLWARQAGVRAAKVIDTVRIGKLWVLIQEKVPGTPLSEQSRFKQSTLDDAWKQVKKLHDSNMAHRDLRAANLLVDTKGQAWLIDFGFAEVSPNKQRLCMDIAELLMSMTLLVGAKRTLDAASKSFDKKTLTAVLPYLQLAVFSGETSKQLKRDKSVLEDLKTKLKQRLNIREDVENADILRLSKKKVINLVLIAIFFYVVIPQLKDFSGTLESLSDIHTAWLAPIALASALTYFLTGLIYVTLADVPLKVVPTALVQLAASFVSKIMPGGLGSTTLNARYLTKAGLSPADASAVIVTQGALGFIMFIVPLAIFLTITGSGVLKLLNVHVSFNVLAIVLGLALLAAVGIGLIKSLRRRVFEAALRFIASLRDITTSPTQLGLASSASLAVTFAYIICLYLCFQAVGVHLSMISAIALYATATIAKSTIPTPGGLGPIEVAMASGLIGLGVAKPSALSVVILYRLATFWLPIPFSFIAYKFIIKRKLV